jgi:hypothetical protein
MNTSNLERHYANLTVNERASLMIAAKIRGDHSERKKLIASAELKNFTIRGDEEATICEAWFNAHISLVLLNMEQRIAELSSALVHARLLADDKLTAEFEEGLSEQMSTLQIGFREQRKATLLAFHDWMAMRTFPIDVEMLEECNVDFELCDDVEENKVRGSISYRSFATQLEKIEFSTN